MVDSFFQKEHCDRCGGSLDGIRIMSMFNTEVICSSCKEKERAMPEYKAAQEEELRQVLAGNRNFEGVGFPGK